MFHDKKYADPKVNQIRMVVKKKKPFWWVANRINLYSLDNSILFRLKSKSSPLVICFSCLAICILIGVILALSLTLGM
jgi:hypothetical protein